VLEEGSANVVEGEVAIAIPLMLQHRRANRQRDVIIQLRQWNQHRVSMSVSKSSWLSSREHVRLQIITAGRCGEGDSDPLMLQHRRANRQRDIVVQLPQWSNKVSTAVITSAHPPAGHHTRQQVITSGRRGGGNSDRYSPDSPTLPYEPPARCNRPAAPMRQLSHHGCHHVCTSVSKSSRLDVVERAISIP